MQTFFKYKDRSRFCDLQSSSNSSDNSDHEKAVEQDFDQNVLANLMMDEIDNNSSSIYYHKDNALFNHAYNII